MGDSLYDLVRDYRSLSISGMCKNAGKTTALNSLIRSVPDSETLALTSIGWDGEREDIVTGTQKPGIYIREGSLFATADGLLRHCDVTKEILEATNISTPLGEVVLLRALSDGNVQLAGPSMVMQLVGLSRLFREHGAGRVIIDGAVGRKTLCSRILAEATVLCTGASFSRNMDEVVAETAHVCNLLMTAEVPEPNTLIDPDSHTDKTRPSKYILLGQEKILLPDGTDLAAVLKQTEEPRLLYVEGAVTDSMLDPVLRARLPEGLTIATRDASRLLLSADTLRKLKTQKCNLGVLEGINLAAVTVNPFSAYGNHFDKSEFINKMAAAVPVPVVDVECKM